jgi:xanthine dehydrogenase YagR molybdenum-binding subunit
MKLRTAIAQKLGLDPADAVFDKARVRSGGKSIALAKAAADGEIVAEDMMEYGDLDKTFQQSTFGAHFVEAAVDAHTGEIRIRRMLAVCAAGRILNPKAARSHRRDDDGRGRRADGGTRGRQTIRLLREPRPRRL